MGIGNAGPNWASPKERMNQFYSAIDTLRHQTVRQAAPAHAAGEIAGELVHLRELADIGRVHLQAQVRAVPAQIDLVDRALIRAAALLDGREAERGLIVLLFDEGGRGERVAVIAGATVGACGLPPKIGLMIAA